MRRLQGGKRAIFGEKAGYWGGWIAKNRRGAWALRFFASRFWDGETLRLPDGLETAQLGVLGVLVVRKGETVHADVDALGKGGGGEEGGPEIEVGVGAGKGARDHGAGEDDGLWEAKGGDGFGGERHGVGAMGEKHASLRASGDGGGDDEALGGGDDEAVFG